MTRTVHVKSPPDPVVSATGMGVTFPGHPYPVIAVEGVTLNLYPGRVTGVLGESGSGKSQFARALTGLTRGRIDGAVQFRGTGIGLSDHAALNAVRGGRIAYVFQDPMTCLNPYLRISVQMAEVAERHLGLSRKAAVEKARGLLDRVRIPDAEKRLRAFPHELSGGMRQRVMIAMAMMADPDVIIADEPTTALDATVQVQVLDLLRELCDRGGLAMLVITHDVSVLARIADDVMILYAGRQAESGPVAKVFAAPLHPYTRGLIDSTPDLERPVDSELSGIPGNLPGADAPRDRCLFAPRCPKAQALCRDTRPEMLEHRPGRLAACHFPLAPVETP